MKRIAFIPLDNRPVCYDLAKNICDITSDFEILLPPIEHLGGLFSVSNYDELLKWFKNLSDIDYLVVALDTIAYGSLVASRRINLSFEDVKKKIENFFELVKEKQVKVLAFSSIMRISNNNVNEEEKEYWNRYGKKIFDYSYNLHKSETVCENDANLKCNCISNIIPKEILDDYLATRERNFSINKLYVNYLRQGLINTLVFSKDDCAKYGLNVKEAIELENLISKDNLNGIVKTGADEIPLSLLSKIFTENKKIKIFPYFISEKDKNLISKYEDVSVEKSVGGQINLAGCEVAQTLENSDIVMVINNFEGEQGELVMNVDTQKFVGDIPQFNKPVVYLDVRFANGADDNFAREVLKQKFGVNYLGYAAWNTTANTVGSGLAIALAKFCTQKANDENFSKLQLIRFLDDWAYQANVRKQIRDNKVNLSNDVIYKEMKKYENVIKEKFLLNDVTIEYSYPWDRFFEIRIQIL